MTKQQLIEDNMKLVYLVLHKHFPRCINDEDIVQTGMFGLCKAADTWIEDKGKFSTYACRCIRNAINNEFRYRDKHKNILSLDYEYDSQSGEDDVVTLGDKIIGETDVEFDYSKSFYDTLSPHQIEIIELRKSGLTISDISRHFNVSRQSVWSSLRYIQRRWNKYIGQVNRR